MKVASFLTIQLRHSGGVPPPSLNTTFETIVIHYELLGKCYNELSMAFPENEPVPQQPEAAPEIQEYPDQPEIPAHIEQAGVQTIPPNPASLQDDQGQVLAQSQSSDPPVQIPADPQTIHGWASGSPANSQTWLGIFWERVIKKAMLFGKKVVIGNSSNA